eukprot:2765066-Prymnesium_polylepis.1
MSSPFPTPTLSLARQMCGCGLPHIPLRRRARCPGEQATLLPAGAPEPWTRPTLNCHPAVLAVQTPLPPWESVVR